MKYLSVIFILCINGILNMCAQETSKIKITVGANSFVATLNNNATAKAFTDMLPITLSMSELNGNEKFHYLSGNLPSEPENPLTIHSGDLMLYGSNCIVLFYETFNTSYSYTKIGEINNPAELKAALGSGNTTVTFEKINPTSVKTTERIDIEFNITNNGILQVNENVTAISLLDINGRKLLSSTSNTLNVSGLSKGIYLLLIKNRQETKTFKIKI